MLSMEQFARDKQAVLKQYLAGEIGEQTLMDQGEAWPNYASDYRPLVELNHQVMAINAAFHSDGKLGTVDALKRLKPNLDIRVISPYARTADAIDLATTTQQGDDIYTVQALPKRYVQKQHRDRAVKAMMERKKAHPCAW